MVLKKIKNSFCKRSFVLQSGAVGPKAVSGGAESGCAVFGGVAQLLGTDVPEIAVRTQLEWPRRKDS